MIGESTGKIRTWQQFLSEFHSEMELDRKLI